APSPIPFSNHSPVPIEMNTSAIKGFLQSYKAATQRALEAGFKILEVHAGNGYLLHQFYSGLANQRNDRYGGSFDNRIKLLIEVVQTVKQVWPEDYPLLIRIAARDWADDPYAWSLEQTIELCQRLEKEGVDLIDPVSGFVVPEENIPFAPGFQVPFSAAIKQATKMLVGAVGGITLPNQANKIIQDDQADLIIIARELLRNPYFPIEAAKALAEEITIPDQYLRGF
ncbi:MAG: oxidoreductase, partial [Cyclobacteriaceae bacterium]